MAQLSRVQNKAHKTLLTISSQYTFYIMLVVFTFLVLYFTSHSTYIPSTVHLTTSQGSQKPCGQAAYLWPSQWHSCDPPKWEVTDSIPGDGVDSLKLTSTLLQTKGSFLSIQHDTVNYLKLTSTLLHTEGSFLGIQHDTVNRNEIELIHEIF